MLADQRRALILDLLNQRAASISVVELSELFKVSTMTIRRDLDLLEEQKHIQRVHGGAMILREDSGKSFFHRQPESSEEKKAIGRMAATLVEDHDTMLMDAGTTTLAMAAEMKCLKDVTVITHALPVAQALCTCEHVQVISLGGTLKRKEQCAVGPMVVQALSKFMVDKLFLSAAGIDLDHGLTDPDMMETEVKQAMIRSARKVFLVADSSKWGMTHLVQIAAWTSIHVLVSDSGLPASIREELDTRGVQVIIAS
jgi:DeoR family fructose operon transcriptional repressor